MADTEGPRGDNLEAGVAAILRARDFSDAQHERPARQGNPVATHPPDDRPTLSSDIWLWAVGDTQDWATPSVGQISAREKSPCPVAQPTPWAAPADEKRRDRSLARNGPGGQAAAVSKRLMLRVSRLNSMPMRWTGRPAARYFAA